MRDRLTVLHEAGQSSINPETAPLGVDEDDDDYEPDFYATEDNEQILNKLDTSPIPAERELEQSALGSLTIPAFRLPPPPTLNPEQAVKVGEGAITRVFGTMRTLEDPAIKKPKAGINRLAASSYDRDSWITIITRLATRATTRLDDVPVKDEDKEDGKASLQSATLSNSVRELLYAYILEDFRKRIEVAVSWLSEEWYNDKVQQRSAAASATASASADQPPQEDVTVHYDKWALRVLDGFFPYLHAQDKVLTRFLSQLPALSEPILGRVKLLCRDPSLVQLALNSLYYLVMMRPPVRDLALDAIQDIWSDYEDARPMAAKYLQRWRPGFLAEQQQGQGQLGGEGSGGGTPAAAGAAVGTPVGGGGGEAPVVIAATT